MDATGSKVRADFAKQLEANGLLQGGYGSWQALKKKLLSRFTVYEGKLLHNGKEVVPTSQWDNLVEKAYCQMVADGSVASGPLPPQIHQMLAQSICVDVRQHGLGVADVAAIISASPHIYKHQGEEGAAEPARPTKHRAPPIPQHETECHFFVEAPTHSVVMLHVAGMLCVLRQDGAVLAAAS